MWVELHGMADDVCHFVEASVVHTFHRVQDASLHRFQAVFNVGDGPFQNNIAGIVKKPVLVHPAKVMHCGSIEAVNRAVAAVGFCLSVVV